jgi:hypothetical protein
MHHGLYGDVVLHDTGDDEVVVLSKGQRAKSSWFPAHGLLSAMSDAFCTMRFSGVSYE